MESQFKSIIAENGIDKTYYIGFSGGLDSHALLHLCHKLSLNCRAIYVNHGLSENADSWALHCSKICENLKIPFVEKKVLLKNLECKSIEAEARKKRYQAFAEILDENSILLTAHHEDDQAETLMLQLVRGAGPKGLAAMPEKKLFAKGLHLRPFLNFKKNQIKEYAEQNDLHWIEDESNLNLDFSRNFLRQKVFPLLKTKWPNVESAMARSAENCASTQNVIESYIEKDFNTCFNKENNTIAISKSIDFAKPIQVEILRYWLSKLNITLPSKVKMQNIQNSFLFTANDKEPHIVFGDYELRRYKDELYAMQVLSNHDASQTFVWDFKESLNIKNIGKLVINKAKSHGLKQDLTKVTIKFRQGGERIKLSGRNMHHDLKNLLQKWGVPPWERSRIPLIYCQEKLIGVVGYFTDDDYNISCHLEQSERSPWRH